MSSLSAATAELTHLTSYPSGLSMRRVARCWMWQSSCEEGATAALLNDSPPSCGTSLSGHLANRLAATRLGAGGSPRKGS